MRIGARVREAHLSNHCPGGLGFPVTSWHRAETGADNAHTASSSWLAVEGHQARAAGAVCARCRQVIAGGQNVRCRDGGDWVHEAARRWPAGPRGSGLTG